MKGLCKPFMIDIFDTLQVKLCFKGTEMSHGYPQKLSTFQIKC